MTTNLIEGDLQASNFRPIGRLLRFQVYFQNPQQIHWSHCDQSNYTSPMVFSHIPIEFCQAGISAIRSADPENPTVQPNMKWIGRPLAEIWPFEFSQMRGGSSQRSDYDAINEYCIVLYSILYTSYTDLIYSSSLRQECSARGVKTGIFMFVALFHTFSRRIL